jgi:hypothetical protein
VRGDDLESLRQIARQNRELLEARDPHFKKYKAEVDALIASQPPNVRSLPNIHELVVEAPEVAAACHCYALCELWFLETQGANRRRRLRKPALARRRFAHVLLESILVEPRKEHRRKRRFCKARRRWKSLTHVRGSRKLLKLS